jgi:hypothetical protein
MPEMSLRMPQTAVDAAPTQAAAPTPWALRVLTVWLVLVVVLLLLYNPAISAARYNDPDDALRLVEVRDLLNGQGWFDLHQYRNLSMQGAQMHWSRLVDIPLAGMMLALRPLLGPALAEMVAVVMVPLLTLLAALMLIGRLAAKFFDTETVGIACMMVGIAGPLLFQMTPLRIDHHGWQVVMALAALNGLAARDAVRGGLVIGAALATSLTISIEGLPITLVFLGILALRGLIPADGRPRSFAGLAAAARALALTALVLFVSTRGLGDLTTHCDQVSPIHLALFALAAAGSGALALVSPQRRAPALAMLGATGAGALALYLGAAPQCKGGAFVALDPLVARYWYQGVSEGMPFWHLPAMAAIETLCVPLVGLVAAMLQWRGSTDPEHRAWWRDHTLALAGAWLIGCALARASATACAFAVIPSAALILRLIVALRTVPPGRRALGYMGVVLLMLPPIPLIGYARIKMLIVHDNAQASAAPSMTRCNYSIAARALNALPPADIFAPLDMGPDLLERTRDRVVATGHHRGAAGIHDVLAAFMGTPDQARAIVHRRQATLIAICPDLSEPDIYAHYAPHGFMARLLHRQAPDWLQPVDLAPGSGLMFWRVK